MVPEGTDVEKMMLNTLRQQQHQLLYNKLENGHYRVAALSTVNDIFNGNDGELLNIAVSGTGSNEVSISDIHFIDVRGNARYPHLWNIACHNDSLYTHAMGRAKKTIKVYATEQELAERAKQKKLEEKEAAKDRYEKIKFYHNSNDA